MKIIGFLFILGLIFLALTLLFGFSFLRMIFIAIFGTRPAPRNASASSNQQKSKRTGKQEASSPPKKIITRDEGEYVDFEEIKD